MAFVIATYHTPSWDELASLTDDNKEEYCKRHGYHFMKKGGEGPWYTGSLQTYHPDLQFIFAFERARVFLDAFNKYPDCKWIFVSDADALITNQTITLDRLVDDRYHVILASDINGTNCGNLFVRNTDIGRSFCRSMWEARFAYSDMNMVENQWIQEMATATYWRKYIKIVPQRLFNSYDYTSMPRYAHVEHKDVLGVGGQWQSGDFILHVVDKQNYSERLDMVKRYLEKVIK